MQTESREAGGTNSNTHHGGAGHSSSVLARAELSGRETPVPPPGEGWC